MGNVCMKDDRSQRLARRRERERLVSAKYSSPQMNPDVRRQLDNGGLESGFAEATKCHRCHGRFNVVRRRHHCRRCKNSFCNSHSARQVNAYSILEENGETDTDIPNAAVAPMCRVCENCFMKFARSGKTDGGAAW
jgi:hypothetical protein